MARSSTQDPIEKFRFQVVVFQNTTTTFNSGSTSIGTESSAMLDRAGFSEATLPKVSSSTIKYRENVDGMNHRKLPGLSTYEPVLLRRGVTPNQSMYYWYKKVNDDSASISKLSVITSDLGGIVFQDPNFRREVLISTYNRDGSFGKHWLLYNAYPTSYKGGNDLDSKADEKLVEEVTLEYESFLEVTGDTIEAALNNAVDQSNSAAEKSAAALALSLAAGTASAFASW